MHETPVTLRLTPPLQHRPELSHTLVDASHHACPPPRPPVPRVVGFMLRGGIVAETKRFQRAARRQMVLNMFYLKATEDLSPHAWASILDDNFTCVAPITPFRSFPPSEVGTTPTQHVRSSAIVRTASVVFSLDCSLRCALGVQKVLEVICGWEMLGRRAGTHREQSAQLGIGWAIPALCFNYILLPFCLCS